VLLLRGEVTEGRKDELQEGFQGMGFEVRTRALYRMLPKAFDSEAAAELKRLVKVKNAVWMLTQQRAVTSLRLQFEALAGDASAARAVFAKQRAIAIHPKIVDSATLAGFGRVVGAPTEPDVLMAALESLRE
jgi:uroporphyrinogen-III synthase